MRIFYSFLVSLHPRAFRKRFAEEMLLVYEEAAGTWGAGLFFRDVVVSLLRNWLVRAGLWKWFVAGIAGLVPLIIAFGSFLPWDRPVQR